MHDEALLVQWQARGDGEAFRALTQRYGRMVYAAALRVLRNPTDAEDVAQDCFEKLAAARRAPDRYLGPWLHRMAVNRALDRLRVEAARKRREVQFAETSPAHPAQEWPDIYPLVDEAIDALPDQLRRVLVAHYMEGLTHEAIAERESVTRSAVTQRIQRGLEQARAQLRRKGVSAPAAGIFAGMLGENMAQAAAIPMSLAENLGRIALAGPITGTVGAVAGLPALPKVVLGLLAALAIVAGGYAIKQRVPKNVAIPEVTQPTQTATVQSIPGLSAENTDMDTAVETPQPAGPPEPAPFVPKQTAAAIPAPSASTPDTLLDETLLNWVRHDAEECGKSRDQLGLPDVYLIVQQKDRQPLWREAAQRGMPEGQVLMALCHAYGIGVENDPLEKCSLLRAAIDQGDAAATYYYADALFHGEGVDRDVAAAVELYNKAAAAGDRAAMWQLGALYGNGEGVQEDPSEALKWLEKSAEAGAPYAMFQLGQAYFSGDLGPQDEAEGRKWIAFAADLGCPFGVDRLRQLGGHTPFVLPPEFVLPSDIASSPFGPAKETPEIPAIDPAVTRESPSPRNLSDAEVLAEVRADEVACRECRDRAGYSKVYIQLHASRRLPLWQEAANRGMAEGQVMLGLCYTAMIGFERDDIMKAKMFQEAAEKGDPTGMHNYATLLKGGIGTECDPQEAFNWWKKAADLGEPSGMSHIAESYRRGDLVERDTEAALDWYLRAADAGSAEAKYQLGLAFLTGQDMAPKDVAEGRRWLAKAAEGGFPKAVAALRAAIQAPAENDGLTGAGAATETPVPQTQQPFLIPQPQ